MTAMYDVTELATAAKPWLLGYLLGRERQPIAYFDPDIRFFDQIDEIAALATGRDRAHALRGLRSRPRGRP